MIRKLISSGRPFAIYNLPGTHVSVNIVQKDKLPVTVDLTVEPFSKGFYFMPFSFTEGSRGYLIRPDIVFTGDKLPVDFAQNDNGQAGDEQKDVRIPEVTKEAYLEKIRQVKEDIRNGRVEKVVLSRPVGIPIPAGFDPEGFYRAVHHTFPDLFTFFVHIPGVVTWAGATPELLAGKEGDSLLLSALAGTVSGADKNKNISWTGKEHHEHALVGRHILEMVSEAGFPPPQQTGTETFWSGPLAHLRTMYKMPFPGDAGVLEKLVCHLHPTPAVGGYPKREALDIIARIEGYDRSFYSGILGPWDIGNTSRLFVNLRSVQITSGHLIIYAGGGITHGSDPEKEWEETEQKAHAMLSVLEKMTNFVR